MMSGQKKSGGSGTKAGGGLLHLQHGRPGNQMGILGILGVVGEGIEVFNLGQMALGAISQRGFFRSSTMEWMVALPLVEAGTSPLGLKH